MSLQSISRQTLQAVKAKRVGVLGGGIAGLAAAFYLRKKFGDAVNTVLFEKTGRCGGWIKTVCRTDGDDAVYYELGPRTMRPGTESGMNSLDLIEQLGLSGQVMFIDRDHPAAKKRCILYNGNLVALPSDLQVLFKKMEPFSKPLIFAGLRDLLKWRKKTTDDSVYNFMERRFGEDIAKYVMDPVIRGVCGGDAKNISVKLIFKNLLEYEQKYGSVIVGLIKNMRKKEWEHSADSTPKVGFSNIALASIRDKWSVWALEGGLQLIPYAIEEELKKYNVQILKDCQVKGLRMNCGESGNEIEVQFSSSDGQTNPSGSDAVELPFDHIISTIPARNLAELLRHSSPLHPKLYESFNTIQSASIQVTNLMYKGSKIDIPYAFGFLVPSASEVDEVKGLLGVVFDTCTFPQGPRQILTVMSTPGQSIDKVLSYMKYTLKVSEKPDDIYTEVLENCIPQYAVGHYEKIQSIRDYIDKVRLPLSIAGACCDGISVNDAIFSSKTVVDNLFE